jgi:threonine/homoserine/homoserine lactone efflux protein
LIQFLLKIVGISLSGVMAPGPITAATLAAGVRSPHAGVMVALGHAAIEVPLMLLIVAGAGAVFEVPAVKLGIGLAGGAFLLFVGVQLLMAVRTAADIEDRSEGRHPFVIGLVLTAANPYFLIWWATVGLALATEAVSYSPLAFVLFAAIHWLCDLVWLEILSFGSHKGTEVLGGRLQQAVLLVCGLMLLGFGVMFLQDSYLNLLGMRRP